MRAARRGALAVLGVLALGIALGGWRHAEVVGARVADAAVTNRLALAPMVAGTQALLALGGRVAVRPRWRIERGSLDRELQVSRSRFLRWGIARRAVSPRGYRCHVVGLRRSKCPEGQLFLSVRTEYRISE